MLRHRRNPLHAEILECKQQPSEIRPLNFISCKRERETRRFRLVAESEGCGDEMPLAAEMRFPRRCLNANSARLAVALTAGDQIPLNLQARRSVLALLISSLVCLSNSRRKSPE